jgi:hypothetical protein
MINIAEDFLSPVLNGGGPDVALRWSHHAQPRDALLAIDKVRQLPRRAKPGETGYDALGIVVIDMPNDGGAVRLVTGPPAPQPGDSHHYASMIDRLAHIWATRFKDL